MMKVSVFLFSVVLLPIFAHVSFLHAKPGKVFFKNGQFLKGDIEVRDDEDGRTLVVIAMKSGSVTLQRADVANIIYLTEPRSSEEDHFYTAFRNTPSKQYSSSQKSSALYEPYIRAASNKNRLDPELVKAVIKQESNFKKNGRSHKGAQGLMQLMPDTAKKLGVVDAYDPWENIHGGAKYLKKMLQVFNGDIVKALAAYNAGPNAVKKYDDVPPYRETQNYVKKVMKFYRQYRGNPLYTFTDTAGQLIITDRPNFPQEVKSNDP